MNFSTDPDSFRFRTQLTEGSAKGLNFAGHIAAITWRCGTSCQVTAFVDVRKGYSIRQSIISSIGVAYRRNSRLFVADHQSGASAVPRRTVSAAARLAIMYGRGTDWCRLALGRIFT